MHLSLAVHGMVAAGKGLLDTHAGLEVDLGTAAVLCALGGNHDDAACCGSTVKCGSGCVLKDGHALDIVGVEAAAGDAVHHIERIGACSDGAGTADADLGALTGLTGCVHNHNASCLTLEHVSKVGSGIVEKFLAAEGHHGAGEFVLLLRGVTHNNDFVKEFDVLFEENVNLAASVHLLNHIGKTEKIESDRSVRTDRDGVVTVQVSGGSTSGGDDDSDTYQRLVRGGIFHCTLNDVLGESRERCAKGKEEN